MNLAFPVESNRVGSHEATSMLAQLVVFHHHASFDWIYYGPVMNTNATSRQFANQLTTYLPVRKHALVDSSLFLQHDIKWHGITTTKPPRKVSHIQRIGIDSRLSTFIDDESSRLSLLDPSRSIEISVGWSVIVGVGRAG
jgi:hypothetical protein